MGMNTMPLNMGGEEKIANNMCQEPKVRKLSLCSDLQADNSVANVALVIWSRASSPWAVFMNHGAMLLPESDNNAVGRQVRATECFVHC